MDIRSQVDIICSELMDVASPLGRKYNDPNYEVNSDEMQKIVNDYFVVFSEFIEQDQYHFHKTHTLLRIGKYYLRYKDAFEVYKKIHQGYLYDKDENFEEYYYYFKENFDFNNCLYVLNELIKKCEFRISKIREETGYLYVLNKIENVPKKQISKSKAKTIYPFTGVADYVYDIKEIGKNFHKDPKFTEIIEKRISEEYEKKGYAPSLTTSSLSETTRAFSILISEMETFGIIKSRGKGLFKFAKNPLEKNLVQLEDLKNRINTINSLISLKEKLLSKKLSDDTILSEKILKSEFAKYQMKFGFEWEQLCYEIAELKHEKILRADKNQTRLTNNKIPDIIIVDSEFQEGKDGIIHSSKIIDAKKSYVAIGDDVKNYISFCDQLEFWILDDKIFVKNNKYSKIKYVYAKNLVEVLKSDIEFINSESDKTLIDKIEKCILKSNNLVAQYLEDFYLNVVKKQ